MSITEAYHHFVERLSSIYTKREASNIAELVFEHDTGINRLKRITEKGLELSAKDSNKIHQSLNQLLQHKPVQYVLGEAWFFGKKFIVNDAVLIPRPETEELVELAINDRINQQSDLSIIDIGTGSGCIAIALKSKLPEAEITAIDISDKALEVAKQNGMINNTMIHWEKADILNKNDWETLNLFDVIVSNPPYIPSADKSTMADNVLKYEPHIALFAPGNDPLIFYRAIAAFGSEHLKQKGKIFVEIHESLAEKVKTIFHENHVQAIIHKDIMGKDRMVTAWK